MYSSLRVFSIIHSGSKSSPTTLSRRPIDGFLNERKLGGRHLKFEQLTQNNNRLRVMAQNSNQNHVFVQAAARELDATPSPRPLNGEMPNLQVEDDGIESKNQLALTAHVPPQGPVCPCSAEEIFSIMREEAMQDSREEPALASFLYSTIMSHRTLTDSISFLLGNKLGNQAFLDTQLMILFRQAFAADPSIAEAMTADLLAVFTRDPACEKYSQPLLYFKGFQALQAHRVSHHLWTQGRKALALALQSRVSETFHVDIHPAATIGRGIMLDHATGLVIGETAKVGDNVSILHHVTLGGTGSMGGDRHPKIGDGVLIGAGVTVLGPIRIGDGAKIGAGSVVLNPIPDFETAVGVPAKIIQMKKTAQAKTEKEPTQASLTMDQTSFINDINWSDYNI